MIIYEFKCDCRWHFKIKRVHITDGWWREYDSRHKTFLHGLSAVTNTSNLKYKSSIFKMIISVSSHHQNLTFPLCVLIPFHKGFRTESKLSMPYGVAASARAAIAKAVIVRTFCCSSTKPGPNKYETRNYTGTPYVGFFTKDLCQWHCTVFKKTTTLRTPHNTHNSLSSPSYFLLWRDCLILWSSGGYHTYKIQLTYETVADWMSIYAMA